MNEQHTRIPNLSRTIASQCPDSARCLHDQSPRVFPHHSHHTLSHESRYYTGIKEMLEPYLVVQASLKALIIIIEADSILLSV